MFLKRLVQRFLRGPSPARHHLLPKSRRRLHPGEPADVACLPRMRRPHSATRRAA